LILIFRSKNSVSKIKKDEYLEEIKKLFLTFSPALKNLFQCLLITKPY